MVFDGEFQVGGTLKATKHWCERGWRLGAEAGTFYAFDCLTLAEWRAGGTDRPLHERKAQLQVLGRAVDQDPAISWEWRPGSRGRDESGAVHILPEGWAMVARDVVDDHHLALMDAALRISEQCRRHAGSREQIEQRLHVGSRDLEPAPIRREKVAAFVGAQLRIVQACEHVSIGSALSRARLPKIPCASAETEMARRKG